MLLNGERINHLRPYERNVSTVFQNYALFPHLTVRGNVEFGLRRRGERDLDSRVREVLELVQLAGKESRSPAQLSGGERQRVALARSLVLSPDVLLLDEPLSALDPKLRKQVRAELKSLQRRVGITFLFVTHDQEEALSMSDQIAVMNGGRLEQVGTPEDIYLRPRTRFVAEFLGAMNWIDGIGVRPEATRISRARCPNNGALLAARARRELRSFSATASTFETRLRKRRIAIAECTRRRMLRRGRPGARLVARRRRTRVPGRVMNRLRTLFLAPASAVMVGAVPGAAHDHLRLQPAHARSVLRARTAVDHRELHAAFSIRSTAQVLLRSFVSGRHRDRACACCSASRSRCSSRAPARARICI